MGAGARRAEGEWKRVVGGQWQREGPTRRREKRAGPVAGQKARESGSAVELAAQQAESRRCAEQEQAARAGFGDDLQLKARERVVRRVGGSIAGYFVFHAGKRTMRLTTVNHALWLRDSG